MLVTNGGKQAVANAFAALLRPGDEVLVPAPYWTTYPEAISLAGGVPVVVGYRRVDRLPGAPSSELEAAAHAADQGAGLRLALQPDRGGLPAGEIEAIGRWAARAAACGW